MDLHQLPGHLLEQICAFLSAKDLINLCLSGKSMHQLLCSLNVKLDQELGVSKRRYYQFGRNTLTSINFEALIEQAKNMQIQKPNWKLDSLRVNLAKVKQLDRNQIEDMTERLPTLLTLHDRLTSLKIEASASYTDGPFQQVQPQVIFKCCPNLTNLMLIGREQHEFTMWDENATFETKLKCLKLAYITPLGLPELMEHSPGLQSISIHDYGTFPPYETKPSFAIVNPDRPETVPSNLSSVSIKGMSTPNLDVIFILCRSLSIIEIDLEVICADDTDTLSYLQETIPTIFQWTNPKSLRALTLGTLTQKDQIGDLESFESLDRLSLRIDCSILDHTIEAVSKLRPSSRNLKLSLQISNLSVFTSETAINFLLFDHSRPCVDLDTVRGRILTSLQEKIPFFSLELSAFSYPTI